MITIKNVVRVATLEFENGVYHGTGEARVNELNEVIQVLGTIYREDAYAGSFSSLRENSGLKLNLSAVEASYISEVAEVVNGVVADITAQYK